MSDLEKRLKRAEAVCLMYGWSRAPGLDATDRELATLQLWMDWVHNMPGGVGFMDPDDHPEFDDAAVKRLADKRRRIVKATRKKIATSLVPA